MNGFNYGQIQNTTSINGQSSFQQATIQTIQVAPLVLQNELDMSNNLIIDLADPVNNQDAMTLAYANTHYTNHGDSSTLQQIQIANPLGSTNLDLTTGTGTILTSSNPTITNAVTVNSQLTGYMSALNNLNQINSNHATTGNIDLSGTNNTILVQASTDPLSVVNLTQLNNSTPTLPDLGIQSNNTHLSEAIYMNGQKITDLQAGTVTGDAINYDQYLNLATRAINLTPMPTGNISLHNSVQNVNYGITDLLSGGTLSSTDNKNAANMNDLYQAIQKQPITNLLETTTDSQGDVTGSVLGGLFGAIGAICGLGAAAIEGVSAAASVAGDAACVLTSMTTAVGEIAKDGVTIGQAATTFEDSIGQSVKMDTEGFTLQPAGPNAYEVTFPAGFEPDQFYSDFYTPQIQDIINDVNSEVINGIKPGQIMSTSSVATPSVYARAIDGVQDRLFSASQIDFSYDPETPGLLLSDELLQQQQTKLLSQWSQIRDGAGNLSGMQNPVSGQPNFSFPQPVQQLPALQESGIIEENWMPGGGFLETETPVVQYSLWQPQNTCFNPAVTNLNPVYGTNQAPSVLSVARMIDDYVIKSVIQPNYLPIATATSTYLSKTDATADYMPIGTTVSELPTNNGTLNLNSHNLIGISPLTTDNSSAVNYGQLTGLSLYSINNNKESTAETLDLSTTTSVLVPDCVINSTATKQAVNQETLYNYVSSLPPTNNLSLYQINNANAMQSTDILDLTACQQVTVADCTLQDSNKSVVNSETVYDAIQTTISTLSNSLQLYNSGTFSQQNCTLYGDTTQASYSINMQYNPSVPQDIVFICTDSNTAGVNQPQVTLKRTNYDQVYTPLLDAELTCKKYVDDQVAGNTGLPSTADLYYISSHNNTLGAINMQNHQINNTASCGSVNNTNQNVATGLDLYNYSAPKNQTVFAQNSAYPSTGDSIDFTATSSFLVPDGLVNSTSKQAVNGEVLNTSLLGLRTQYYPQTTSLDQILKPANNVNMNNYSLSNLVSNLSSITSGSTVSVNAGDIYSYVKSQSLPTSSSLATISNNTASTTAITASNQLISNVLNPVSLQDVCTLNTAQTLVGTETTRAENAEGNINTNLTTNYYTQTQCIANFCSRTSPTVSGNLNMNSHVIQAVSNGSVSSGSTNAVNGGEVYTAINSYVPASISDTSGNTKITITPDNSINFYLDQNGTGTSANLLNIYSPAGQSGNPILIENTIGKLEFGNSNGATSINSTLANTVAITGMNTQNALYVNAVDTSNLNVQSFIQTGINGSGLIDISAGHVTNGTTQVPFAFFGLDPGASTSTTLAICNGSVAQTDNTLTMYNNSQSSTYPIQNVFNKRAGYASTIIPVSSSSLEFPTVAYVNSQISAIPTTIPAKIQVSGDTTSYAQIGTASGLSVYQSGNLIQQFDSIDTNNNQIANQKRTLQLNCLNTAGLPVTFVLNNSNGGVVPMYNVCQSGYSQISSDSLQNTGIKIYPLINTNSAQNIQFLQQPYINSGVTQDLTNGNAIVSLNTVNGLISGQTINTSQIVWNSNLTAGSTYRIQCATTPSFASDLIPFSFSDGRYIQKIQSFTVLVSGSLNTNPGIPVGNSGSAIFGACTHTLSSNVSSDPITSIVSSEGYNYGGGNAYWSTNLVLSYNSTILDLSKYAVTGQIQSHNTFTSNSGQVLYDARAGLCVLPRTSNTALNFLLSENTSDSTEVFVDVLLLFTYQGF